MENFEPDVNLLAEYSIQADQNFYNFCHNNLLKIKDFDSHFCALLNEYKLLNHLSEVYCFAGIFVKKIDSLNTNSYFDSDKRIKGYNEQYKQLRDYIYSTFPKVITFDNKIGQSITIDNRILIQELLISIDKLKKPSREPISENSQHDTFRADFLTSTKPLYDFIVKHNKDTKPRHRHLFICKLLELLGFDWKAVKTDPVAHLKRKYK